MDNESEKKDHGIYEGMYEQAKQDRTAKISDEGIKKRGKTTEGKEVLKGAEAGAEGGLYTGAGSKEDGEKSAKEKEEKPDGFRYTGSGKENLKKKKTTKAKIAKMSAAAIVVFIIAVVAMGSVALGNPTFMIGHLDYNLQDSTGFTRSNAILEKQAEYVEQDDLKSGKVPDALAGDLAANGIIVGQVTASGDFVRTNEYIANIDELKDLAVLGHYEVQPSEGELAVLFNDKVVKADDFVVALESDPAMYNAFSLASNIAAKNAYDELANKLYTDILDADRSYSMGWVDYGDSEKNNEEFTKSLKKMLDGKSSLSMAAVDESTVNDTTGGGDSAVRVQNGGTVFGILDGDFFREDEKEQTTDVTGDDDTNTADSDSSSDTEPSGPVVYETQGGGDSEAMLQDLSGNMKDKVRETATAKVAGIVNASISATEPYMAAKAFIAVEAPIQQARIEGTGPVHELMNLLYKEKSISYTDLITKEVVTENKSIITTNNFVAATSAGKFSKSEAANFARDSILAAIERNYDDIIGNTIVSTDGQKESKVSLSFLGSESPDMDELQLLKDRISMALVEDNYDLMTTIVGGNRIVEGGAFISNLMNSFLAGASASDANAVLVYNKEADTQLALKAAGERAAKSPFDISSPNTFMGSIVHGFANTMVRNGGSSNIVSSSVGAIASLTGDSTKGIFGSALADGENDTDYGATFGNICETAQSANNAESDIYCTAFRPISIYNMSNNRDDWKSVLGDNLDDSGSIKEGSELSEYVLGSGDRLSSVGVVSAEVCEAKKKNQGFLRKALDIVSGWVGMYDACSGVDEEIATGAKYVDSSSNVNSDQVRKFSSYLRYDRVVSLLHNETSKVSEFRDKYYAKYPKDDSRAGRLARISGLTKAEAEVALAYTDYWSYIARYNPAERYAFGVNLMVEASREPLVDHANQVAVDLYVMWHGRIEYDDLRTRTRVA